MKKLLRKHPETFLILLATFFLAFIVISIAWGTDNIVGVIDRVTGTKVSGNTNMGFDLNDAQNLDLRGLVNESSSAL
jgi:hypothetical protein